MKFTRESAYALHGLLAKIFQKLTHQGVVRSFRGARRGYSLAREPRDIKIRKLLEAVEGPDVFDRCIFWSTRCNASDPCPLHEGWNRLKPDLVRFLDETTPEDLWRVRAARRPNPTGNADASAPL